MSKSPGGKSTRASSGHFLVGQEQPDLGKDARGGKLPLTGDVMRYFFHRKNLPNFKFKPVKTSICCPFKTGSMVANCQDNPLCTESSKCVVSMLRIEGNWNSSGIPTIADLAIIKKIEKLNDQFKALDKHKKNPNRDLLKRMEFSEKMDELFDISVPGVEDKLVMDRLRKEQAREEDIIFLEDQRDTERRKMSVSSHKDLDFEEALEDRARRYTREERMKVKDSDPKPSTSKTPPMEEIEEDEEIDEDDDTEFVPPQKVKNRENFVTLTVDRKRLAKDTAITAKRYKIGISGQRDMLANIINVGGGNVDDFSLSNKTVRRAGTVTVKEAAEKIKNDFTKILIEDLGGKEVLIVYFDGKAIHQFHDKIKSVKKRISVIAGSPLLPSDQVLGVPFTPSNSGKDQKKVVMEKLEEWGIESYICGLGFDTTSDNTGRKNGAVVLIEKALGRPILWLACPHHFYEVHVKKAARFFLGETTNPEETTYKRLKDDWNKILENNIDYDDLEVFDWKKWRGTYLAKRAREVLAYLQSLLENNTFPREDLKELLILVLVWLGVKIERFSFQYPGAMSHARFLMQSIYSMKIYLLSRQLDIYSDEELRQIKDLAMFVGLFHAPWYFSSPLASSAPMLHLLSISQMKQYKKYFPDLAGVVLDSISLHLWYLTPQCVPLALIDKNLSADQRSWIATGLSSTPRQEVLPLGKPSFPDLSSYPDKHWNKGKLPELSTMLGPESWLLFNKLGLSGEDLDWLLLDPLVWDSMPGYIKFRDFVQKLTIVNDPAERGVGLMKEFISTFQNEESCQDNLLAVSQHRKVVSKNSKKEDLAKIGLD